MQQYWKRSGSACGNWRMWFWRHRGLQSLSSVPAARWHTLQSQRNAAVLKKMREWMGELEDVVLVPQRITKPLQCPCCEMAYTSITVECSSIGEDEGVDGEWKGCGSSATKDYIACPCCEMAYTSPWNSAVLEKMREWMRNGRIWFWRHKGLHSLSLLRDGVHFSHRGMQQYWRRWRNGWGMGGYGFGATKDYIACPCYEMAYTSAVFCQKEVTNFSKISFWYQCNLDRMAYLMAVLVWEKNPLVLA